MIPDHFCIIGNNYLTKQTASEWDHFFPDNVSETVLNAPLKHLTTSRDYPYFQGPKRLNREDWASGSANPFSSFQDCCVNRQRDHPGRCHRLPFRNNTMMMQG